MSELTDNEDGTYTATITSSTTPGTATITATDLSTESKLSGSASLTQDATSTQPPPPPAPTPPTQPQVSFSVKPPLKDRNRRPRFVFAADVAGRQLQLQARPGPLPPLQLPAQAAEAHASVLTSSRLAPARRRAREAPPSGTSGCWDPSAGTCAAPDNPALWIPLRGHEGAFLGFLNSICSPASGKFNW